MSSKPAAAGYNIDSTGRQQLISVIVPFHNEEDSLVQLIDSVFLELRKLGTPSEVILVDDGSTDASFAVARGSLAKYAQLTLVSLRRKYGKSAALAVGVEKAAGDTIITIDADLQDDPANIPRLLEALQDGLDLVCGWRKPRRDSFYKRLQSRLYNFALKITGFRVVHDINCGLKAMRRDVASAVPLQGERHRLIPLIAAWQGFRVGEVVVNHRPREHGKSKYGTSRILHAVVDIFTALALSRFYKGSAHVLSAVGTLMGLAGLVICSYITCLRIATGSIQYRYPLLILGVLLLAVGVQLVLAGFICELTIHTRAMAVKNYSVKEIIKSSLKDRETTHDQ